MEIIRRHRNNKGITIGYTINNNGSVIYLNSDATISMSDQITNATLLSNDEFRAKLGYRIDTAMDNCVKEEVNTTVQDYYGNGCIDVCKEIRKCALNSKLEIEPVQTGSTLAKLISASGIELGVFIRGYLSELQPYCLEKSQYHNVWLCDLGYNITLDIRVNEEDKDKMLSVSFHQDSLKGNFTRGCRNFNDKPCAVIVDKVTPLANGYSVDYLIQRGFIRYSIHSATIYYNNGVALVKFTDIKSMFDDSINLVFDRLKDNYLLSSKESIIPVIERKHDTNRLSFMSMGFSIVNNIYLLIELYAFYTDKESRAVLIEITNNIVSEIPDDRLSEIKAALIERFEGSNNKLYLLLVEE